MNWVGSNQKLYQELVASILNRKRAREEVEANASNKGVHGSLNAVWLPGTDPSAWSPDPSARSPELSAWSPERSA